MISREDQWRGLWFEAHQTLMTYLEPAVDDDPARAIASRALGYWLQSAGDGLETTHGSYAALLEVAKHELTSRFSLDENLTPYQLGLPDLSTFSTLPYSLGFAYCDFRRIVQLCGWDKATIHRLAKALSQTWPVSREGWGRLVENVHTNLVTASLRRALEVRATHACDGCLTCEEFGVRWEKEDQLTADWLISERIGRDG